ncbi:ctd small phosphatase-like protein 2 [Quercus suber]|uniref:Ctd small phosphatase-like protein 2 n=1 Tax=Quercus suber TaxID=58331 RepID=A0AAW0KI02_QUESU
MQTKKKNPGRSAARENVSSRVTRAQQKVSEKVQAVEVKVKDLITSSARKQKQAGALPKKKREPVVETNLNAKYELLHNEASDVCLGHDVINDASMEFDFVKYFGSGDQKYHQDHEIEYSQDNVLNVHIGQEISKPIVGEGKNYTDNAVTSVTFPDDMDIDTKNFNSQSLDQIHTVGRNAVDSCCNADLEGANLSSEVSAIYLAMKNSKLECIDEHGQDSMSADVYVEDDQYEEFDDFDPYFFIKNLPDLSAVVPTFRPMLLPKQTRSCPPTTLVLDLDETLVHSTLEPCDDADFTFPVNFNLQEHTVYVRCRPHLRDFLERVSCVFEIIIFTASQSIYAEQLLNVLDPKRKVFRHRVYRDSCVYVDGNYLKDLTILGRDLARVIIIDNSPQAFGFQVDNGIPIESWFDDRSDKELLLLLPFLESLVGVEDVRPLIAKKFNLREKIAAAVYPLNSNRGDPFER